MNEEELKNLAAAPVNAFANLILWMLALVTIATVVLCLIF